MILLLMEENLHHLGCTTPLQVVGKTYLLGAAFLKPSTEVFMVFCLLEPPQKEIMGKMVFIFPMLDKVDVFAGGSFTGPQI